jgi:hypothetical protein
MFVACQFFSSNREVKWVSEFVDEGTYPLWQKQEDKILWFLFVTTCSQRTEFLIPVLLETEEMGELLARTMFRN